MNEPIAINVACQLVGGQSALAGLLGVSSPTVNQWCNGVRPVPAERCPSIERATSGEVTCEELRPDVDWEYLRGAAAAGQAESGACITNHRPEASNAAA
ncbi:helix-turn-helix domain-containing protein [Xylella fastidiosa subsp. sandyi]